MKKFFLKVVLSVVLILSGLLAIAYWGFGFSPVYLYNAPSVATGIGAKLACSAHFVTKYSEQQTEQDIESYSPLLSLLQYQYNEKQKKVSASFGPVSKTASFQKGIGCSIDYDGYEVRNSIQFPQIKKKYSAWPAGNIVATIDEGIQQKLDSMLERDNKNGHDTRAFLVVKDGRVVAESYADFVDENTPLLGWSMAKSVNSLLLGQLEMLGRVNVDETDLFREWRGDDRKHISLKNLLQMTDGLDYDENYNPGSTAAKMLFQEPDATQYVVGLAARTAPGTEFNYSSGSANLISRIVQERIEGNTSQDVNSLVANFFEPLGMTSMVFEMDASGMLIGSSYMLATARDWARIGQLMLDGGIINGERLVSQSWVDRSLEPNSSTNKPAYGYQWWLNKGSVGKRWPDLPTNTYAALGDRHQSVLVIPDEQLVIVRLGWSPKDYPDSANFKEIMQWFH